MDVLAGRLGVRKLSDFYDYSELEEEYGDLGEDEGDDSDGDDDERNASGPALEERQSKGDWFDSAVGLESVRKLRERLTAHFDDLGFNPDRSTGHWPKQLMDELSHAEQVLSDAASHGQRFRLLIVP